jgi:hypothetical protein
VWIKNKLDAGTEDFYNLMVVARKVDVTVVLL